MHSCLCVWTASQRRAPRRSRRWRRKTPMTPLVLLGKANVGTEVWAGPGCLSTWIPAPLPPLEEGREEEQGCKKNGRSPLVQSWRLRHFLYLWESLLLGVPCEDLTYEKVKNMVIPALVKQLVIGTGGGGRLFTQLCKRIKHVCYGLFHIGQQCDVHTSQGFWNLL